jgi:hypothetical protein
MKSPRRRTKPGALGIKSPRLKGSKTGGKKALIGLRRPLREEKRETMKHRLENKTDYNPE